jgi:hypothetical protein
MAQAIQALAGRLRANILEAERRYDVPRGESTLLAIGNLLSIRSDAMKQVPDRVAQQLADDVTRFIELSMATGGFKRKFQALLRTLVYLTRRRAYQPSFLSPDSDAFERAVRCCARVYISARLASEFRRWQTPASKDIAIIKAQLKASRDRGGVERQRAMEATAAIIDSVADSQVHFPRDKFPKNPTKLLQLLLQVVEYIEGRGTGILVIDDSDDDDGDGDGGG